MHKISDTIDLSEEAVVILHQNGSNVDYVLGPFDFSKVDERADSNIAFALWSFAAAGNTADLPVKFTPVGISAFREMQEADPNKYAWLHRDSTGEYTFAIPDDKTFESVFSSVLWTTLHLSARHARINEFDKTTQCDYFTEGETFAWEHGYVTDWYPYRLSETHELGIRLDNQRTSE